VRKWLAQRRGIRQGARRLRDISEGGPGVVRQVPVDLVGQRGDVRCTIGQILFVGGRIRIAQDHGHRADQVRDPLGQGWILHPDVAGALAERAGRKRLLVAGWALALPVPLLVGLAFEFAPGPLVATKRMTLGDSGDNPILGDVTVGGQAPHDGMTIPADTDVALHDTAEMTDEVDWLTSVGHLDDEDNADANLIHETDADPPQLTTGHLAVVKRDDNLGVTWGFWTISVQ